MRGGTSKGIFFKRQDLPSDSSEVDEILIKVFGSGDRAQIDGLGGAATHTSKAMIVSPSDRPGTDIDYLFAQVGITERKVDYSGTCGNLTAAVAAYAVDEAMLRITEPKTHVRMYNVNSKKRVDAWVSVEGAKTLYQGDYEIDGVPNAGSPIKLEFHDPGGSMTGKLLPTGKPLDEIHLDGKTYGVSIVDAANPTVFVKATELGLTGIELENDIPPTKLLELESIRSKAAEMIGLVSVSAEATSRTPHFPYIAFVSQPRNYVTVLGKPIKETEYQILSRLFSFQKMHHAYPLTGAICTGAAAVIEGTVVNEVAKGGGAILIGHPKGLMDVEVRKTGYGGNTKIDSATVHRTARRLMDGVAYYL